MTQATENTTTTETAAEAEPDFWAMVAMMAAAEQAEIVDMPVTGRIIPFPSPFAD